MNVQVFLTVWMSVQVIFGIYRGIEDSKGDNPKILGCVIGSVIKFVGMAYCLCIGGFYG